MSEREWRPALSMRWKHLLFVHWRVPVASLRPLIPEPLQIDTYDGAAWVGFVPFVMESVRPVWLPPIPKLFDFPEANVRTYVRYGEQRGVWFFSLDAAHRLGVWVARRLWKLPYHYAHMWWEMLAPNEIAYSMTRKARPLRSTRPSAVITCTPRRRALGETRCNSSGGALWNGAMRNRPCVSRRRNRAIDHAQKSHAPSHSTQCTEASIRR